MRGFLRSLVQLTVEGARALEGIRAYIVTNRLVRRGKDETRMPCRIDEYVSPGRLRMVRDIVMPASRQAGQE